MDKFCFLASKNRKQGWVVETKNVFKIIEGNRFEPINLEESSDTIVYVRNVGVPLNNLLVVGSDGKFSLK